MPQQEIELHLVSPWFMLMFAVIDIPNPTIFVDPQNGEIMRGQLNEALVLLEMKPNEDVRLKTIGKISTKTLSQIINLASIRYSEKAELFFKALESKDPVLTLNL